MNNKPKILIFILTVLFSIFLCSAILEVENVQAKAKNKNDVKELKRLIKIQNKRGAKVSTDLNNKEQYKWNKKTGRLVWIAWDKKNLKGKINFNKLNGLWNISVNDNKLKNIYIKELTELGALECKHNKLKTLTLGEKLQDLEWLICDYNNISSLKIENLEMLEVLSCSNNEMNRLILKNLGDIYIDCDHNNLKKLEFEHVSIMGLNCSYNKLRVINKEARVYNYLICSYNKITKIKQSTWDIGCKIWCDHNKLTTLNLNDSFSDFPCMGSIRCQSNNIKMLDFSNVGSPEEIICDKGVKLIGIKPKTKVKRK